MGPTAVRTVALVVSLALSGYSAQDAVAAKAKRTTKTRTVSVPTCSTTQTAPLIYVPLGKSTLLKLQAPASRIILGNPGGTRAAEPVTVPSHDFTGPGAAKDERPAALSSNTIADVDVLLMNPTEIYVLGRTVGSTNLIVVSRSGVCTIMDIAVGIDTKTLESRLNQFLPGSAIKVTAAADSILLSGQVADATKVERAMAIAAAFTGKGGDSSKVINMLTVADPQQVMLEVKVAEINRTLAEKLGFDFARQLTGGGGAWTKIISGIVGGGPASFLKNINSTQKIGSANLDIAGPLDSAVTMPVQVPNGTPGYPTLTVPAGATASMSLKNGMVQQTATDMATQDFTSWLVDAQKTDGLVKILAEPNIVAISGQEGSFLAGGEIMIPVPEDNGAITLQPKEFGVGLRFTPTVLDKGRINIKVSPEVTDLVGFNPVATSGLGSTVVVPTFTTRRTSTTVQLRDGQSLAIGGLLQDNFREQVKRFPILGEIPVIGTLFRSSEYQKNKTELMIVITPRLIKPLAPDYTLPTDGFVEPSRSELLFEGKMEGGKPQNGQSDPKASAEQQPAQGGFELK